MEHPIDFYTDTNYSVLEKMASLPDSIWEQNIPDYNIIPEKSWAYIEKEASGEFVKRFPIDCPASVVLSKHYLETNKEHMDKQAYDRTYKIINDAANAMGINDLEKKAATKTVEPVSEVIKPKTVEDVEKGWKNMILDGINGAAKEDVLGAMQKFDHYSDKLNPKDAFDVAKKIIKRANEFNISVSKTSKLYKFKMIDENVLSKNASVVIKMRKPYYNEGLNKLASELLESLNEMSPVETANVLYEMDKMAGVTQYYNREVPNPFTNVFGKTAWGWISRHKNSKLVKEAADKLSVYFNDDIVKLATEDVMKAYKNLGPQARGVFRKILDKIDFNENKKN